MDEYKEYIAIQEGIYLGFIEETECSETYAVLKVPQLEKPVVVFSPELSLRGVGTLVYSKDRPEDIGKEFPLLPYDSPVRELKAGDRVAVYFIVYGADQIKDDDQKVKSVMVDGASSYSLMGKLKYEPAELKKAGLLPFKKVVTRGRIVEDGSDDFVIDGEIPIVLQRPQADKKGIRLGDWVESPLGQIYFGAILRK